MRTRQATLAPAVPTPECAVIARLMTAAFPVQVPVTIVTGFLVRALPLFFRL